MWQSVQVFLCGFCATACSSDHIWVELHAQPQKQLGCKTGRGPRLVLSLVSARPGANRCCKHVAGRYDVAVNKRAEGTYASSMYQSPEA